MEAWVNLTANSSYVARLGIDNARLNDYPSTQTFYNELVIHYWETQSEMLRDMNLKFSYQGNRNRQQRMTAFRVFQYTLEWSHQETKRMCIHPAIDPRSASLEHMEKQLQYLTSNDPQRVRPSNTKVGGAIFTRIAKHMREQQLCVIDGRIYEYIDGTSGHAVQICKKYKDVTDEKSGVIYELSDFIREMCREFPDIQEELFRRTGDDSRLSTVANTIQRMGGKIGRAHV